MSEGSRGSIGFELQFESGPIAMYDECLYRYLAQCVHVLKILAKPIIKGVDITQTVL
jgi:hypothetical protein